MTASIQSRGPDELSLISDTWFGLGFCRLSIVALNEGHQPASSAGLHLVFNGEIYNYLFLQQKLMRDHGIAAVSEAQVLLHLYELLGPSFVRELDGDFAIVVLDSNTRTCFAFRDPYGVKPVYYAWIDETKTCILASHFKAFFEHQKFSTDFDFVALAEMKVLNFWSSDRTCFAAIRQIPPGHFLTVHSGGAAGAEHASSKIVDFRAKPPQKEISRGEAENLDGVCLELMRKALRKRVEHSDVTPVVIALSGGIDSTLIAALAATEWPERLSTVTVHDGQELEDLECASELASSIGLTHHSFHVTTTEFADHFPRVVLECASPNPVYTPYFLSHAVRNFHPEAKVLLCGEGADEFFVGYPLLLDNEHFISRSICTLADQAAQRIAASPLLSRVEQWQRATSHDRWLDLLNMFQNDQLANLHLLPFDHGSMAHSVECRVPYVDSEVIEFIQRIPAHLMAVRGTTKILLRVLVATLLKNKMELAQRLLSRRPSPAFYSTLGPRQWLRRFLSENLPTDRLARSDFAPFARNLEELFWLASVAVVYLKYRGRIEGLSFPDLVNEVSHGLPT